MITWATKSVPSINMATKPTAMNAVVEEEVPNTGLQISLEEEVEEEVPIEALHVNMATKMKAKAMRTAVVEEAVPKQAMTKAIAAEEVLTYALLSMTGENSLNMAMKMKALNWTS